MELTPLDEVRITAVIQRDTTAKTGNLVLEMKRGAEMMRLFERTYCQFVNFFKSVDPKLKLFIHNR